MLAEAAWRLKSTGRVLPPAPCVPSGMCEHPAEAQPTEWPHLCRKGSGRRCSLDGSGLPVWASAHSTMSFPKSWSHRRNRRNAREHRQAIARIGLSTSGSPVAGETALCIAYMCPWAHGCAAATPRPALVSQRKCLRCYPADMRPSSGLSDHSLDVLAERRENGERFGAVTVALLDQFRPSGPTPSLHQRLPRRPVYDGAIAGRP